MAQSCPRNLECVADMRKTQVCSQEAFELKQLRISLYLNQNNCAD